VTLVVNRNYLEIKSLSDLHESQAPELDCLIQKVDPDDFQINKFFYKNIGKKHQWTDRIVWTEKKWIEYSSDPRVDTFILKVSNDFAGYFELILHKDLHEIEIAYLGILEQYHNKKLGSYLLSTAIKKSFEKNEIKRVWVHTCTLDHKNALQNYLARGMKIFKNETIQI